MTIFPDLSNRRPSDRNHEQETHLEPDALGMSFVDTALQPFRVVGKLLTWPQYFLWTPPFNEQEAICAHLERELVRFNDVVGTVEKEISLLREYQTRLISDVVTGKLDVREVARSLPADVSEEADELAATESADEDFATDDELVDV